MARVLIAGLGKGIVDKDSKTRDYKKANYKIKAENGDSYKIYRDEYFITSALEKHYNIDKTIYIGTTGSMWDRLYAHYCKKNSISKNEEYEKELKEITQGANKNTDILQIDAKKFNDVFLNSEKKVEIIVTKYGMNENEIFENFNSIIEIVNSLDKNDEVYLDITHSFRSNAMWVFLVMNYLTDVVDKDIKIEMITYGMLEEMDTEKEEKDEDGNPLRTASIINLKSFYNLMRWIKGANAFKEYGNSYEFLDMVDNEKLKENLKLFSDAMNLNYITSIKKNINEMTQMKKIIETLEGPEKLLLPPILNEFMRAIGLERKNYNILLNLAEWHYKQKRYSMTCVNIIEAIHNFVFKVSNKSSNIDIQEWIFKKETKITKNCTEYPKKLLKKRAELKNIYKKLKRIRNSVSHTLNESTEVSEIISKIDESFVKLKEIFEYEDALKEAEKNKIENKTQKVNETKIEKEVQNKIQKEVKKETKKNTEIGSEKRIFVISETELTENQKIELEKKFNVLEYCYLNNIMQKIWKSIDFEKDKEKLKEIKETIRKKIDKKDYIFVEGEQGCVFDIVKWAKKNGIIPIYKLIQRKEEEFFDGDIKKKKVITKYLGFRKY